MRLRFEAKSSNASQTSSLKDEGRFAVFHGEFLVVLVFVLDF